MKIYRGKSKGGHKIVTVDDHPLASRASDDRRNAPFDWGTDSLGTRHLAEALLADCAGAKSAPWLAHEFARELATWPSEWETTSKEIEKWLRIRCLGGQSAQEASLRPFALAEPAPSPVLLRPDDFPRFPVDTSRQRHTDALDSLRQRIQPVALERQGFPRPKDVRLSRNADSTGEDAFYVYLVFPDNTPERALSWEKIEPMVSWVRNLIWTETGARLWPYVKVKRQKELAGGRD